MKVAVVAVHKQMDDMKHWKILMGRFPKIRGTFEGGYRGYIGFRVGCVYVWF